jgi:hypothetical protein
LFDGHAPCRQGRVNLAEFGRERNAPTFAGFGATAECPSTQRDASPRCVNLPLQLLDLLTK